MLYEITDTDDAGDIVHRIVVDAPHASAARVKAGKMPTMTRTTKILPGCHLWGQMVVANQ